MSQNQAFCPSCGAAVSPGAHFCRACGTPIGAAGVKPDSVPESRLAPSGLPPAMPSPTPRSGAAPASGRKTSPVLLVIGGLVAVCVCLVCGLGSLVVFQPRDGTTAISTPKPGSTLPTPRVLASKTQPIGPEGGIIVMDSGARLVFPAGALAQKVDVQVRQLDPTAYLDDQSEGMLLDCSAPVTKFQQNIEFHIPLPSWYTPEQADAVIAGTLDDTSNAILSEPATIQMVGGKPELVVQANHFSTRFFGWLKQNYGYPPTQAGPIEVPYYSQGSTPLCTAAALQMIAEAARHAEIGEVFNIVGAVRLDPSGISPRQVTTSTLVSDLLLARTGKRPERVYWRRGTQGAARTYIRRQLAFLKRPVLLASGATGVEHTFVIVGYDGAEFVVHDPQGLGGDIYKYMSAASLGLEASWDDLATVVVPSDLSADRPRVTVNIMDASLEFINRRERFQFRWDYTVPEGYSFRTGDAVPAVATIPSDVTELRLVFGGGGIEISNAYQTGGTRRVSVWIDIKGRGPNNTTYSDRTEVVVEPWRAARVPLNPIAVDRFRDPAPTPTEYVFTVTALVEGKVVDSASFRFVMEPGGTTTPTATSPLTRTPTSTVTSTTAAPTPGEWVLEAVLTFPEPGKDWANGCYYNHQVSIGDGAFASSGSWKDEGCASGGPYYSGSRQTVCSWTPPPSYLKAGSTLSLSASCQSTAQQTGGGKHSGGGGGMHLTLNPRADNLGGYFTWSTDWSSRNVNTSRWSAEMPVSDSKSGSFKIPEGKKNDVLVIVASWKGDGGSGRVVYKYVYGASVAPPARSVPPTATPLGPISPGVTPTRTNTHTVTPSPTNTRTLTPTLTRTPTEISSAVEEFFRVFSIGVANNGATKPTTFTIAESWLVTSIHTYHWNNGKGATPGTIGLRASNGTIYGPWKATGEPGQGGLPNAFWVVKPNVIIPMGTYTVLDSDPSTWAQNSDTGGAGMAYGYGIRRGR